MRTTKADDADDEADEAVDKGDGKAREQREVMEMAATMAQHVVQRERLFRVVLRWRVLHRGRAKNRTTRTQREDEAGEGDGVEGRVVTTRMMWGAIGARAFATSAPTTPRHPSKAGEEAEGWGPRERVREQRRGGDAGRRDAAQRSPTVYFMVAWPTMPAGARGGAKRDDALQEDGEESPLLRDRPRAKGGGGALALANERLQRARRHTPRGEGLLTRADAFPCL